MTTNPAISHDDAERALATLSENACAEGIAALRSMIGAERLLQQYISQQRAGATGVAERPIDPPANAEAWTGAQKEALWCVFDAVADGLRSLPVDQKLEIMFRVADGSSMLGAVAQVHSQVTKKGKT